MKTVLELLLLAALKIDWGANVFLKLQCGVYTFKMLFQQSRVQFVISVDIPSMLEF